MSSTQTQHFLNYYEILGADPLAQLDEIEALFRQLAFEAETTGDHSKVPQAMEAFKVLRDPNLRQQYDQQLAQFQARAQQAQQSPAEANAAEIRSDQIQQQLPQTPLDQGDASHASVNHAQSLDAVHTPLHAEPQQRMPVAETSAAHEFQTEFQQPSVSQAPACDHAQAEASVSHHHPSVAPEAPAAIPEPPAAPTETTAAVETFAPYEAPSAQVESVGAESPVEEDFTPTNKSNFEEELKMKPDVLDRHRRELLKMFYEKRRRNMRASGMAIGGLDSLVSYSYELLEFHLWVLSEKKWVVREESGALSISALGCENHENNLTEGLIDTNL